MPDLKKFAKDTFKAAQSPAAWLMSAERMRDGAEAILTQEQPFEIPYLQAHEAATQYALAQMASGTSDGIAEIKARVPNYPAAQLLYAYALENLLKGLIVAKNASLVSGGKLNKKLLGHDLKALAADADFTLYTQEVEITEALSKLSVWAGRYPVALFQNEFAKTPNADELLDYGSRHPYVRALFKRCHDELGAPLPKPLTNRFGVVVVLRPPGI